MAPKLGLNLGYWGIGPRATRRSRSSRPPRTRASTPSGSPSRTARTSSRSCPGSSRRRPTIKLGAAIMQVPARPPAAAAMAGATIDALSGGRFIFGFGPSGPQVSEGWYGVEYAKPWGRTREYIEIVREIVARKGPLEHSGEHWQLPIEGGTGPGQGAEAQLPPGPRRDPRSSSARSGASRSRWPPRSATAGSRSSSRSTSSRRPGASTSRRALQKGGRSRSDLEISPSVQVAIDGDLDAARAVVKAGLLLYLGGMGSRKTNFYVDLTHRFGFGEVADEVQSALSRRQARRGLQGDSRRAGRRDLAGRHRGRGQAKVASFSDAGIDRLICSPVHLDKDERLHTIDRLAALVGASG